MGTVVNETKLWRICNFIMSVFFAMAAFVQAIYVIPSVLSFAIVVSPTVQESRIWNNGTLSHVILCICMACYVLYELTNKVVKENGTYNPLHHEEGREFFGLLIIIIWLQVCRSQHCSCFMGPEDEESVPEEKSTSNLMTWTVIFSVLPLLLWALCYIDELQPFIGICRGMFMD